jgi:hypothetical protein
MAETAQGKDAPFSSKKELAVAKYSLPLHLLA